MNKDRRKADRAADAYAFIKTEDACLADIYPPIPADQDLEPIECPKGLILDEDVTSPLGGRFYHGGRQRHKNYMSHDSLVEQVSQASGLKKGVVSSVLMALCQVIARNVLNGLSVQLFGLGSFFPITIHQKRFRESTSDFCRIGFIRRMWLTFEPSRGMMKELVAKYGMRNVRGWDWIVPRRSKKRIDSAPVPVQDSLNEDGNN